MNITEKSSDGRQLTEYLYCKKIHSLTFSPLSGHTELPNCPVCLERMDESVDGILTILCNHSFHGECLAKWGDTR